MQQQISQASELHPYRLREMQEKIQSMKLANEADSTFNMYQPEFLSSRNKAIEFDNQRKSIDNNYYEGEKWFRYGKDLFDSYKSLRSPFDYDDFKDSDGSRARRYRR